MSRTADAKAPRAPDFADVFAEEHAYVLRSLRRLGVPDRDLEDVAHDTFIVVHRKLALYDPSRPLRPFLFGIAFRVASDYRRRARHRYELLGEPAEPAQSVTGLERELAAAEAQRLVLTALGVIEPDRSAVLVMIDIDGYSANEVATTLEIPLNTVYSRLRIARGEFASAVRRLQLAGGRR